MKTGKATPRYRRAKEPVSLRLQPRDIEILRLIYEYRFLQAQHLMALLQASPIVVRRRLMKLYHNQLVDRLHFPLQFYSGGQEPFVYSLDLKGAALLATHLGIETTDLHWSIRQNKIGERYLRHGLMIANFHTLLFCGIRANGTIELVDWRQGKELDDSVTFQPGRGAAITVPVVPDAYCELEDKRPGTEGRMYFFIECDRSTMSTARYFRKLQGYWHYWLQGKQTAKYGIKDFRVLTVTKSRQRRDNLAEVCQAVADQRESGYMFWFAYEDDMALDQPGSVWQPIWKTAILQDRMMHSLGE